MTDPWHQRLAVLAALTLPLGFYGGLGIAALCLGVLRNPRLLSHAEPKLIAVALPLAAATILATVLQPETSWHRLGGAAGMALLYTGGLILVQAVTRPISHLALLLAYTVGATMLAGSVFVDYLVGWHHIPSGLFTGGPLHNWTASTLVLAFPLALQLAGISRYRLPGLLMALSLVAGVVFALSWVGVLGLIAAAGAYAALHSLRAVALLGGLAVIATATSGGWLEPVQQLLRAPAFETLGEILFARLRIFAQGLQAAAHQPWLGWGHHAGDLSQPLGQLQLGLYYVDDLALPHFHNLYVQTLFETGLVGLMALALLLGYLMVYQRGPWSAATRAALVGFFTTQFFDYAWTQWSIVFGVWLVASLGLAASRAQAEPPQSGLLPPPSAPGRIPR